MRRSLLVALPAALLALTGGGLSPAQDKPDDKGFVSIFDGKSLKGWKVSAETGHSRASKNKSGGKWAVEGGAITGCQDVPGNGGIVITQKQDYRDFEVVLDMKNDYGPDSGLFLRSNDKGQAYQALIDYHNNGSLMGVYGEGLNPGFHVRNFSFVKDVTDIKEEKATFKLPISPAEWPKFWKHGEWNELKARIEGNPAKMTTWIKGVKWMEWTDTVKRDKHDRGGIALQVHGGGDHTKEFVRYRNIRVKVLD